MSIELTKVEMLEDLRVTVETIEQVHPDPFLHCGGRVAFFNAVHQIARSLPPLMSVADFGIEVGKVTALVGDGHTFAYGFDDADDDTLMFGVWFGVVAGDLVLMRTHHDQLTSMFGSRLRAVNGVPVADLLDGLIQLVGADNEVALATGLAARLRSPRWVGLLTSTSTTPAVALGFIDPDGGDVEVSVTAMEPTDADPVTPSSSVDLSDFGRDAMGWAPMPGHPDTTYLRVRVCGDYREAYEVMARTGTLTTGDPFLARRFADRAVDGVIDPGLIVEVPSASSFLGELCDAAQRSGSRRLMVDVRGNPGGQSVISLLMLVAFYGFETAVKAIPSYTIPRISSRRRDAHQVAWPNVPGPADGEMDFTELDEVDAAVAAGAQSRELRGVLDGCPSLWTEIDSRGPGPWWHPDKLLVLTDNGTYSSAYSITTDLCRAGATIIGTPSGQSGNAFGDYTTYTLPHSGGTLCVSYKVFRYWPDDPARGHLLHPDIELSYDDLRDHRFDPNTAVIRALTA